VLAESLPTIATAILPAIITAVFGRAGAVLTVFKDDISDRKSNSSIARDERSANSLEQAISLRSWRMRCCSTPNVV
jgi:hypothetical protein